MKSTVIFHDDRMKSAFGVYPDLQKKVLNEALEFFETVQFTGAEKRFVKGGRITINATFALLSQLTFQHGIKYFLTSKITQDFVERFFSTIRLMSNDRNPCALHVMYRLHRIVTTKLLEDPSFDVLQHRQLFEISNETSPETDFKIDQHEIESTLEKFEIKEIESDGLDMIASDIIKSKGHFFIKQIKFYYVSIYIQSQLGT